MTRTPNLAKKDLSHVNLAAANLYVKAKEDAVYQQAKQQHQRDFGSQPPVSPGLLPGTGFMSH